MKRFYRVYMYWLTEPEIKSLEFHIREWGGKYYYLSPNDPDYPQEWMIVSIDDVFSNFPISPDFFHVFNDSGFLKDCIRGSIRRVV